VANEIDKAQIIQFSDKIHVLSQQMNARFRPYVPVIPMTGDVYAYDGLGVIDADEVSGRIIKTNFSTIDHTRRKIARRRFTVTLPIDQSDVRGKLTDPQGDYAKAVIRAMNRVFDRVVADAAYADVLSGRDFETTITYASEGTTVDATAGVTYEKLLETTKNYQNNDVDMDETCLLAVTGTEIEALMKEAELISGDYTRQFAVEKGTIATAAGHKLIVFGANAPLPVLSVSGGTRSCISMKPRGIAVGLSKEFSVTVDRRPDYVELKQVQVVGQLGAVRTEGDLVQKFNTTS